MVEEAEVPPVGTSKVRPRLLVVPTLVLATLCAVSPGGIANAAPVFDVDGYSACTATTAPAPDQDFDGVVTTCCVQNAGVPAPTRFGMGCVAPMDGASEDERPTIVLPTRPVPPEDPDADADPNLNGLIDLPIPDPQP
jgi:hypothetical protein